MSHPIIFDFDGVIVDSEVIANRALAECLTEHGFPTTADESIARYAGMRMSDCVLAIESHHKRKLPPNFADTYRAYSFDRMSRNLKPVPGAVDFVRSRERSKIAIASSSSLARITLKLELIGLLDHFAGNAFSAADLERGKPHPDIFLRAAKGLAVHPEDCIVIEDGTLGVQGAVAAGMTVIGLTAASHCGPDHAERLLGAGAHLIARNYAEVAGHVLRLSETQPRSRNAM